MTSSESKFKVGDRVRVTASNPAIYGTIKLIKEGTLYIRRADGKLGAGPLGLWMTSDRTDAWEHALQLFRVGDRVIHEDGTTCATIRQLDGDIALIQRDDGKEGSGPDELWRAPMSQGVWALLPTTQQSINNVEASANLIGARVKLGGSTVCGTVVDSVGDQLYIMRDDKLPGAGPDGLWFARRNEVDVIKSVSDWSYAEANKLAAAARVACEAYNKYIGMKPDTQYLPVYMPAGL